MRRGRDGEGGGQPAELAHGERGGGGTRSRSFRSGFEARGRPERGGGAGARASQPRRCRQVEDPRRAHLTITRVGPHMERRALPRGGARRRRAGNALRKPFAFGRVPGDGKGAGMTSRTRARGFSLHGWRCFGASRRFDWPAVDLGLARDFLSEWDVKPRLQSSSRFFGTGDPMKPPTATRRRPINQLAHFFRIFQNSRVHIDIADARNTDTKTTRFISTQRLATINHPLSSSTSSTPGRV